MTDFDSIIHAEFVNELREHAAKVATEVLAEHNAYDYAGGVECAHSRGAPEAFADWQAWRDHVAPILAEALFPGQETTDGVES